MSVYLGLMSGTSMDGIDVALVDVASNKLLAAKTISFPNTIKKQLFELITERQCRLQELAKLNVVIGRAFADAANQLIKSTDMLPTQIQAIGSHGQTIAHDADGDIPYTIQLGCPHTIAELTGCKVVADFRTKDIVLGGRGAPFAPIYHDVLFGHIEKSLALVNIGGIANVSFLNQGKPPTGFDTGPGNCLMDAWIGKHHQQPYDKHGAFAAMGQVIDPLLKRLISDPYIKKTGPKSIGKEYFSLSWLDGYIDNSPYTPEDVQATLLAFTARTVADAIISSSNQPVKILICGGGAHNKQLLSTLADYLPQHLVQTTAAHGINPDYIEAMLIAWLASKALSNQALDMRAITGANKPAILGTIYHPA
jgi:anhydro-N-acetylmuramic acid kinase